MKPIEIHIEGYKIVISEDKQPEESKKKEKVTYIPYPVNPTSPHQSDWWNYPYVTWTKDDVLTNTDTTDRMTPVRDTMSKTRKERW